jgi:hypothetical protein
VFHYTSFEQGKLDRKSGIPARVKYDGIPCTLRQPHDCTSKEFEVFSKVNHIKEDHRRSSRGSKTGSINSDTTSDDTKKKFPNEFLFVISLPKHFLQPLKGYEDDEGLCMVSAQVLSALRPQEFTDVVDGKPWADNVLLLQPHCILRSFLILPADTDVMIQYKMNLYDKNEVMYDKSFSLQSNIMPITSVDVFTDRMRWIRKEAARSNLIPLYHYTSPTVAPMIMRGGLRMSTQGQGDGGVYVSTQGPASYGLGSPEYEVNIIKDCFGVERVNEYVGKGNLDVIIIYGCTGAALEQTPGGRDNAKMVSKSTFENLSLKDANENYFLRPDLIFGVFQVNHSIKLDLTSSMSKSLDLEKQGDLESIELLRRAAAQQSENITRIDQSTALFRSLAVAASSSSSLQQASQEKVQPMEIEKSSAVVVSGHGKKTESFGDDASFASKEQNTSRMPVVTVATRVPGGTVKTITPNKKLKLVKADSLLGTSLDNLNSNPSSPSNSESAMI